MNLLIFQWDEFVCFFSSIRFHISFTIAALSCLPSATYAARLATLSPLATELVYQLGRGDEIVMGMGSPSVPLKLPSPGEWFSPSLERLVRSRVDLVISNQGAISPVLEHGLRAARIPTFVFDVRDWRDLGNDVRRLYRDYLHLPPPEKLAGWEDCVSKKMEKRASFTFVGFVWGDPPILLGRRVFLSRLIESLGGRNLLPATIGLDYPQASKEWLMAQRPDVIFVFDEFLKLTTLEALEKTYWPRYHPTARVLPADHFGRSSFSVFDYLHEITGEPKEERLCARP